jgi:hypothetical protein
MQEFSKKELFHKLLAQHASDSDRNSYQRTLARMVHSWRVAPATKRHIEMLDTFGTTERINAIY